MDRHETALRAIKSGPTDEPQIDLTGDYEKGLFCGLEDVGLQGDGYGACRYGFEAGVERALEWAQGLATDALKKPCLACCGEGMVTGVCSKETRPCARCDGSGWAEVDQMPERIRQDA